MITNDTFSVGATDAKAFDIETKEMQEFLEIASRYNMKKSDAINEFRLDVEAAKEKTIKSIEQSQLDAIHALKRIAKYEGIMTEVKTVRLEKMEAVQ